MKDSGPGGHRNDSGRQPSAAARALAVIVAATAAALLAQIPTASSGIAQAISTWNSAATGCRLDVVVEARQDGWKVDGGQRSEQALTAARSYVALLDVNGIDPTQAVGVWAERGQHPTLGSASRADLVRLYGRQQAELRAIEFTVGTGIQDYLAGRGYDPDAVIARVTSACEQRQTL